MTLTQEQLELLFYLLAALGIGFFFGYFLSRALAREKYEPEIEDLVSTLYDKDSEIEQASQKHGQLKQHLTIQTSELESVKHQMLDTQSTVKDLKKSNELLNSEKNKLAEMLEQKDKYLNELTEEMRFAKNELIDAQSLIDEFKSVNNHQKEKITTAQTEIEKGVKLNQELSKKIELCLDNEKKLLNEKETLISKIETLNKNIDKSKLENQHFEEKIKNISKELEGNRETISELANKNSLLQKNVIEKQKEFEQKDEELLRLKEELKQQKDLSNSLKTDDTRIESLEKEINYLQDNILQKDEEIKRLEKEVDLSKIKLKNIDDTTQKVQTTNISETDKSEKGWGLGDLALIKLAKNAIDKLNDDHQKEPIKNLYNNTQADKQKKEKITLYKGDILKLYGSVDNNLLDRLVTELKDVIYNLDTEQIDCNNKDELFKIREEFLKKRLSIKESDQELDTTILNICEKMREKRDKYRVTFYYLLIKHYNKESAIL